MRCSYAVHVLAKKNGALVLIGMYTNNTPILQPLTTRSNLTQFRCQMDPLEPLEPLNHIPQKHWDTPSKSRLKTSANLLEQFSQSSPGAPYFSRRQLFQQLQVPEASGRRIIKQNDPRRLHNSNTRPETRGREHALTERDIRHLELILWQSGFDGRSLTWKSLAFEANLDISERTVRRVMQ